MKRAIYTIISFAVCMTISGQQISQSNNRYRGAAAPTTTRTGVL